MLEQTFENVDNVPGDVLTTMDTKLAVQSDQCEAPLGAFQKQWFLDHKSKGQVCNLGYAIRIKAKIDPTKLHKAFLKVLETHPALRLSITEENNQKITDMDIVRKYFYIQFMEPKNLDAAKRDMELVSREVLDISVAPAMSVKLYRLNEDDHILLIVFHKMFFDSSGHNIFIKSLARAYDDHYLTAEQSSFLDYCSWQQTYYETNAFIEAKQALGRKVKEVSSKLEIPTDYPRSSGKYFDGDVETLRVNPNVTRRLRQRSNEMGVSLSTMLLGCYNKLLLDYTKQDEVVVGVCVDTRPSESFINTIGSFTNTLPLKSSGEQALKDFFLNTQDEYTHTVGLKEVSVEQETGLYKTQFSFQEFQEELNLFGDDKCKVEHVQNGVICSDLDCYLISNGDAIDINLNYRKDLFSPESMKKLINYYRDLLVFVANEISESWSDFRAPSVEKELSKINRGYVLESTDECLISRVMNVCKSRENHTALIFKDQEWSYKELIDMAKSYAWRLNEVGVSPGDLVGISCERSPDMIASMLGVMMLGAGYVPLDPYFPADRLAFMVNETGCQQVLCDQVGQKCLKDAEVEVISIESIDFDQKVADIASFDLDNVMYVIFTSGSTGRPKGVQTTYRNAMNFLLGMQNEPGIDESHVVLAHTTMCFDISVLEILLPLINSAKIVLAQKHDSIDGKLLKNLVQANGVNYIQATPATWRLLLSAGFNPDQSLRALCGAEPFPLDLASVLVPKCESVWNMYGPTETTVWCSCHKITSTKPPFLVGRPIENTTFYVLDSNLNPVPMGGVGELFIGGAGVSRGFCNREELTKSLFVPDPFTGEGLMYRSGDLARFNNEGVLECLGRGDGQVKLRGYRIELGEIEYVLQEHNCIEQAVVSLREDRPGDQRLVAYVKFKGPSQEQSKIKKYMGTKLPSYMVPAHIISLDSFPLTLSSKVDRKKLPSPLEIDTGEVLSKKSTKRLRDIQKAPQVKYSAPGLVEIKPYGSKSPVVCFSDLTSELNRYSKISSLIEGHPMFGATVDAFEKGMWPVASLNEYVPGLINSVKAALPSGPYIFVGLNDSAVLAYKCAQVFRQFGCIVKVVQVVEDQQDLSSGVVEKFWSTIKLKSIGLRLKLARHLGLPMQNELKSRYLKGVFTKALQRDKLSKGEGEILKIKMDRKSFNESWSMFINE